MVVAAKTHKGLVRDNNEDCFFIDNKEYNLFIIADGMGGHKAGEVASREAVKKIKQIMLKTVINEDNVVSLIEKSFNEANQLLFDMSKLHEEYKGMGTTLTLAYILNDNIYIGHVGDSRAYLYSDFKLEQITTDHTLVEQLIKSGTIKREDAGKHPNKNIITKAIGVEEEINFDFMKIKKTEGSKLLLCSDGLTDSLEDEEIRDVLNNSNCPSEVVNNLVEASNGMGGYDNITAILVEFNEKVREVDD